MPSKAEAMVVVSRNNVRLADNINIQIGNEIVNPKPVVCDLGATMDSALLVEQHGNTLTHIEYYHLRFIAKMRRHITQEACAKVINTTV